ncbi:MAG: RNA polymerase sigma-70 factor [Ignavibacteriales bacterium]|nr:RNA polymerase sigma-70 factor [Ignavibacteriales bacterium]
MPPVSRDAASENHIRLQELQLFQRIKNRDTAAFELLFRTYHARLCSFAQSYVKDSEVAKEIVQALFQKMWESGEGLHIMTSVRSYLYQSVRNLSLDYLKHQRVERSYEDEVIREPLSQKSLDELLNEKELLSIVHENIEKLPKRCKLIFQMYWRDGLSYKEIADVLGLSIKTVETQMGRALKTLRTKVAPYLSSLVVIRFFTGHLS